ncbi:MAG TPA: TolC family protein [Candidatus Paceibacterota bacterium]|nr:TolC family protein [Verrucomicrobiota bacterium]HRY51863.1 TolC family protein [Candidatus Paceibacterota bacterium]HRZ99908.1 TolC family protein [Candidatus Paceibacterota bacterium]
MRFAEFAINPWYFFPQVLFFWTAAILTAADSSPAPVASTVSRITLDALVADVLKNNPELEFYRAEITAARAGRKTAAQWENPEVSVEVGGKRVWERNGPSLGDGVAWSVSVAQPFEFPGRLAIRKAIANRQIDLAKLGLEQFEAALGMRARLLGGAVVAAQEREAAAREVSQRFQSLIEVLVQRDPAGVTPLLDQRIIEAGTIILLRRASQATREAQAALMELNALRGRPPETPLTLTGSLPSVSVLPTVTALNDVARTNNFEVRLRQVELVQQGFRVRLAKNERYPRVSLGPFYSQEEASDEERIVGVGLSMPLPLWNRNSGNIEASEARLQQADALLRLTWRQVERQIAEHALALRTQIDEMSRWRADAAQQFREAAELADRHYRLGAVPVTTYVEMQVRYLDALDTLLATRAEALEHRQQLELLVGMPLENIPATYAAPSH